MKTKIWFFYIYEAERILNKGHGTEEEIDWQSAKKKARLQNSKAVKGEPRYI